MSKINANEKYVPDYKSCETVKALEQEFYNWAYDVCMGKFCSDKGIIYQRGTTDNLYIAEQNVSPKKFYITTTDAGSYYWYFGDDKKLREEIKTQKHAMTSAIRKMRIDSSISDVKDTMRTIGDEVSGTKKYDDNARAEMKTLENDVKNGTISGEAKANRIAEINNKYGTNISADASAKEISKVANERTGGLTSELSTVWEGTKSLFKREYIQSDDSRAELQAIIDGKKNGTLSAPEVNDAIYVWNRKYGDSQSIEIQGTASVKDLEKVMNKKTSILPSMSEMGKELGNLSGVWDSSDNKIVQEFTKNGISGDVMWGVITGKYNKDDAARSKLEKLQTLVNDGKGNSEEATKLRNELNKEYGLNLDDSVTATDIANVLNSNEAYQYKKKVGQIATNIIESKLNENLNKMLDDKIGSKLKKLGINFSFQDRNTIQDIIDIIRGQKYVKFNQEKFLKGLKEQLEKQIDKLINQKVKAKLDSVATKINNKIDQVADKVVNKLDTYRKKLDSLTEKLEGFTGEKGKLAIAEKLDKLISSPVDKVANILNAPDKFLEKIGIGGLGLGNMFKQITQVYTKGFAEKIQKVFAPALNKVLGVMKTVTGFIKKAIDFVNNWRNKAKELVEQWKNKVMSMVQEQTKKLVNEIIKYVKLNIGGLGDGFKI